MSFYVFDLDGTTADCAHRRHLLPNFTAFEDACYEDTPVRAICHIILDLIDAGHDVEIWSGRSERVKGLTYGWLLKASLPPEILTHMRPIGNNDPDEILKQKWLLESVTKPDMIFDDRQKVVDMWRANGVVCAQVAPGDFDINIKPVDYIVSGEAPILVIMVGPSGAGKSKWIEEAIQEWKDLGLTSSDPTCVVSTDMIRANLCDDWKSQKRNRDVFKATEAIVRLRMQLGLRTIVDAMNLKADWRKKLVSLVPAGMIATYVVVDRPLTEKLATRNWRPEDVVRRHHDEFHNQLANILAHDDLSNVIVKNYVEY